MSYVQKILLPGERIVGIAVLHWIIFLRGLRAVIFGGLLGFFSHRLTEFLFGTNIADEYFQPITILAMVIVIYGIFLLASAFIRQSATELVMTDQRLIAKYGIISRATFEIMASRITGANFDQTITGRMMGFGTIWVHGAGGEVSPIHNVSEPQVFYRAIIGVLERFQPRR